jgi:hypothetical protein
MAVTESNLHLRVPAQVTACTFGGLRLLAIDSDLPPDGRRLNDNVLARLLTPPRPEEARWRQWA